MWHLLAYLKKNLVWAIPITMGIGLLFGALANPSYLKVAITPLTILMVYPMMVNLKFEQLLNRQDNGIQWAAVLLNFGVIPFIGYGIGLLFFRDQPMLILGLLLIALLPTSGMTISWTGFANGNINAALKMTVIGHILGALVTPLYAKWLMGEVIAIPLAEIFTKIALVIFVPMGLGLLTRFGLIRWVGQTEYNVRYKDKFPLLAVLAVIGIVFVVMALKAKSILADPAALLIYVLPLLLFYGINYGLATFIGRTFFKRENGIALVYSSAIRSLSIAMALALTAFSSAGSDIAIIIALAYVIQIQSAVWVVKWVDRLFGKGSPNHQTAVQH